MNVLKKRLAALMVASLGLALSVPVYAAGTGDAAKANVSMCIGCHGIRDYHTAYPKVYHVPKIAGQQQQYIIRALEEYKDGARYHPSMSAIARSLSKADMANLAAYYGTPVKAK